MASTVYGTGWNAGESVSVDVVSDDGSSVSLGSATASAGGSFTLDAGGTGLGAGGYGVVASGNQGGRASGVLIVK